jgi:hypothetical protein
MSRTSEPAATPWSSPAHLPSHHDASTYPITNSMRRRRSDELPRFSDGTLDPPSTSFRWRRRYTLYFTGILFVLYILYPRRTPDDGSTIHLDWSKYAYSLYATDSATLCHAVLVFDALAKHGSRADRVLFYPRNWDTVVSDSRDRDSQLLVMARDRYKVKLEPVDVLSVEGRTTGTSHTAPLRRVPYRARH